MDIVLAEIMLFSGYTAWCSCGIVGHVIAYLISLLLNEVLFSLGASLSLLPLKTLAKNHFVFIAFLSLYYFGIVYVLSRFVSSQSLNSVTQLLNQFCNASVD